MLYTWNQDQLWPQQRYRLSSIGLPLPFTCIFFLYNAFVQGRNHGWKVEGVEGLGPNTGARARPKAGLGVVCERGSPPPAVRVRGYHPGKFVKKTDAKSCILVTTCCEISCFLKTTAKKLGDQYIGPCGCCAYVWVCVCVFCREFRETCKRSTAWTCVVSNVSGSGGHLQVRGGRNARQAVVGAGWTQHFEGDVRRPSPSLDGVS